MKAPQFDAYDKSYGDVVQTSIDFSGLPHAFFMGAKAELLREIVAGHFSPTRKPDALDVGCGVGAFHPYVRGMFGRLCGVDVSTSSIAEACTSNPDVEYKSYADGVLPYSDAEFDLTTAVCVMHHVPPPEWPRFVQELRRVTKPGGLVGVIEHNPFNPMTRLAVARCEFDRDANLLRAGTTERLLADGGMSEIGTRFFLFLPWATQLARNIERRCASVPMGAQYLTTGEV
jgi:SAM-dependent methyltransferase